MKANRKTSTLNVIALWLEAGIGPSAGRLSKIEAEIERIRKFATLDSVSYQVGWLRT